MTRFGQTRSAFVARRPPKSAHQLRGDWIAALTIGAELARAAEDDDATAAAAYGAGVSRLMVLLRDLEPVNFPVAVASAQTMAAAWLKLARDFVHPAWSPAARTACAPFLKAGANCLDRLLTNLRTEEARGTRQILGERDED